MEFLNPEFIIRYGGLTLLLVIIFAETGLFFGFFLPGDSLLFVAGLLSRSKYIDQHVFVLIMMLIFAAVTGTCVGYFFGKWAGRYLDNSKDTLIYRRRYFDMARSFYEKHGLMSFILGRFLPVIRTFVPILAGCLNIRFRTFLLFNVVGATLWIASMVMAGHWLGRVFPAVHSYMEVVLIAIVLVTTLPIFLAYFKKRVL